MKKIFCFFFILIQVLQLNGQTDQKPQNLFKDAEYYRLYEEYSEALPLYQQLLNQGYDNAHINYRIGECYLNIPGNKEQAIPHLKEAIKNMDNNFREGSFREESAPIYALFYLGKAYQIKNKLDIALETYNRFLNSIVDRDNYNMNFVNKQIESCEKAREFLDNPTPVYEKNLGNEVNDSYSNNRPVINNAENRLIYTSKLKFYDAVFMAQKQGKKWENSINLATQIKSEGNLYPCSMNAKGDKMVLFKEEDYQGDLYISELDGETGEWKMPEKLGNNINTKSWETHGSLSNDGKTLYFTSNRKGGAGGLDIYVSQYNEEKGSWSKPRNLGKQINTQYNEETPFITENGKRLYFSSQGHEGIGGFDIFYSEKLDSTQWTEPVNVGYPISTTDDDVFFCPVDNGNAGYMAMYSKEGYGNQDIFRIEIYSEDNPKLIELNGEISLSQRLKDISNDDFTIKIDSSDGTNLYTLTPEEDKLAYSRTLKAGSYQLTFEGKGYNTVKKNINIAWDYPRESYNLDVTLNTKEKYDREELLSLSNIFFGFDKSQLDNKAKMTLDTIAGILKDNPRLRVEITGHTDSKGDKEYNKKLSRRRAGSVIEYLKKKGIDAERMKQEAKGENFPVAINTYQDGEDCPEGRKYNRRVEIRPISDETKRIVGDLRKIPNELRKKDEVYYSVLLFHKDEKLPMDYFNQFPSLKEYSIEVYQNGEYIYTMGKFDNQAEAVDPYWKAINLNFDKARIITNYQLKDMLNVNVEEE
jgi:outer membrane protein OmpA-like peptidoglycan-associated protein